MNVYQIPPNEKPLTKLYAFVSEDEKGNHGVLAALIPSPMGLVTHTLVTMNERIIPEMREIARRTQAETGRKVKFVTLKVEAMEDL